MKRTLYLGGIFNDKGGRPSKIALQVFRAINLSESDYFNGGSFLRLEQLMDDIKKYSLIFWFADVPNDKPNLVGEIKKRNSECVLVTSKRNSGEYTIEDIVYHALNIKSNLIVEFSTDGRKYTGRIIDPLGNVFLDHTSDFDLVGRVLAKRTDELLGYTRVSSRKIGENHDVPVAGEFFGLVKMYAGEFHELIHVHPDATNRFLGNASFRCENGFPSFRSGNIIYVSRRNIDKREIDNSSFVAVKQDIPIGYFGEHKPSVDTPIQIALYSHYPNIRFMLHSHTYIENAPFTSSIIPCGCLEEAYQIIKLFPDRNMSNFSVNLKGHGSLALAGDLDHLKNVPYAPRVTPEVHEDYAIEAHAFSILG